MIICVANDRQCHDLFCLMGHDALVEDPRCALNEARVTPEGRTFLYEIIVAFLADRTTEEAIELLREHNVPAGPIYDMPTLMRNAQFQARDMVKMFDDVPTPGSIFKMSETPGRVDGGAPTLDQLEVLELLP